MKASLREVVAYTLYAMGPLTTAELKLGAQNIGAPFNDVMAEAQALAVESFKYRGKTYWRLPANVVPLVPREAARAHRFLPRNLYNAYQRVSASGTPSAEGSA